MQNAFEYEWKGRDRQGRPATQRISIGPIFITTLVGLVLSFTGHGIWNGLTEFVKVVKWW